MRKSAFILLFVVTTLRILSANAESLDDQLARAAALNERGSFREALETVAQLLVPNRDANEDGKTGIAWAIDGIARQNMGDLEKALHSYENAIEILCRIPAQVKQYAATLDDMGSLKAELGQFDEAQSFRIHARNLYESLGSHADVARVSGNLALVAMGGGKRKEARKFLAEAFKEESRVAAPDVGDLAAMYNAQALEQAREKDFTSALRSTNSAIELWIHHYGSNYYMVGTCYSLRGQLEAAMNQFDSALADLQNAMRILKQNDELNPRAYLLVETGYAGALRKSGRKAEAERIEEDARKGLASLRYPCRGCSISASSFR